MKKLASLCLLFICLILVLFLISSPMIDLSALNHRLFAGWSVVGVPHVQAAYTDVVDSLGGQDGDRSGGMPRSGHDARLEAHAAQVHLIVQQKVRPKRRRPPARAGARGQGHQ